jgi:hypothetical protein
MHSSLLRSVIIIAFQAAEAHTAPNRVRVTLRLAVYHQSVCLGDKPLETHDQQLFFQHNTYGHSPYVTSSLMRGCVCPLQLLLVLASAIILRSESRGTRDQILLPQPGGPGPRIYIPQEQGGPVIPPGTGFPFRRILRLTGLRWRYSNPPPRGLNIENTASKSSIVASRSCRTYSVENTSFQLVH